MASVRRPASLLQRALLQAGDRSARRRPRAGSACPESGSPAASTAPCSAFSTSSCTICSAVRPAARLVRTMPIIALSVVAIGLHARRLVRSRPWPLTNVVFSGNTSSTSSRKAR